MAVIITVDDLPASVRSHELVQLMVDGANAKATRVAPCLTTATSAAWTLSTDYLLGDRVLLATGELLQVTVAGTSDATEPTAPTVTGRTVEDGTVTWQRIESSDDQLDEAKLILVGAVKRWAEASSGALASQQAGPFGMTVDTRQRTGFNLWPSEIEALQALCATATKSGAFSLDLAPPGSIHQPWCNLAFGALWCSCGADIAGYPLYEYAEGD